jgi:hypothetical protein
MAPFGNDADAAFPVAGLEKLTRFIGGVLKVESQHIVEIA